MDPLLAQCVDDDTPSPNPVLANGLAVQHLRWVEQYVDSVFALAAKGFPPGLKYCGYKPCTPQEEFNERTKRRENRRVYDIAHSQIFLVRYMFEYQGSPLPDVFLYLPYVSQGGTITMSNSLFTISPVLADRVVSINTTGVFIRLIRGKVNFMRIPHQIKIDEVSETVQVTHGTIYNTSAGDKKDKFEVTVRAVTTLAHYLFCKFGVEETFRKYGKCEIVIGGPEIQPTVYPPEEWVICRSMQIQPKKFIAEPSTIRIAIRRQDFTAQVKTLVAGFFYVVDTFPDRLKLEYIGSSNLWKVLLGHILKSGRVHEGILLAEMTEHINSLDEYIDGPVAEKLKDIGIFIEDFYDLMSVVNERFVDWVLESSSNINSMYDKELSILQFVLYEITSTIFKMYFKLKAVSKKEHKSGLSRELTTKEVEGIFKTFMKQGLIFNITKRHGEVTSTSYSGDNKVLKFTSVLVPQTSSNRLSTRRTRTTMEDPALRLHVSVAEVGGYTNIPKAAPDGRSRLNIFVGMDAKNVVLRDPELAPFLDEIQNMIKDNTPQANMQLDTGEIEHELDDDE